MNLLLDTHTFLWFIEGSVQLSATARKLIDDLANQSFVSVASVWEIAIKVSTGKLILHQPFEEFIPNQLTNNGFELLNIELGHTNLIATLPFHHRDPFDRMLIAQALHEQMPIIGSDAAFDAYGVTRLW
jgi:PIN domain nuclease of toxin-antitoxin system